MKARTILSVLRRGLFLVLCLVLCLAALLSCSGAGYTLKAMFRSSADYDALDEARAQGATLAASSSRDPADAPWPQYRGPSGDGVHDEALPSSTGSEAPTVRWRAPVGPAYSSMAVAADLVITMEQRRDEEAVVAFDLDTGALVWEHSWTARFDQLMSKEGPRATPAVDGDAVFALGAEGELRCLDLLRGTLRWRHALLEDPGENLNFGLSASPRIRDGRVYAQGARGLSTFDAATGELLWTALDEEMAYATPQFGELLEELHLVVCTKERVVGLRADTGVERWSFDWDFLGDTCTQPLVVGRDQVLASSGYGKGAQLVTLTQGASGIETEVTWRSARFKTRYNEAVVSGDRAYGLDEGTLTCIDVGTGRRRWKEGRYGYGQLLLMDGGLLVFAEDGTIHPLRLDPEGPVELGSFPGVDGGMTLNLPALAHGRLLVRNERQLVALDLFPAEAARSTSPHQPSAGGPAP